MIGSDKMPPEYCIECGGTNFRKIGEVKQTRMFMCLECWTGNIEYVRMKNCVHKYTEKNKNKCIHCGESK